MNPSSNYHKAIFTGGNFTLAGPPGLEPGPTVLETAVLPLNYDPMAGDVGLEPTMQESKSCVLTT